MSHCQCEIITWSWYLYLLDLPVWAVTMYWLQFSRDEFKTFTRGSYKNCFARNECSACWIVMWYYYGLQRHSLSAWLAGGRDGTTSWWARWSTATSTRTRRGSGASCGTRSWTRGGTWWPTSPSVGRPPAMVSTPAERARLSSYGQVESPQELWALFGHIWIFSVNKDSLCSLPSWLRHGKVWQSLDLKLKLEISQSQVSDEYPNCNSLLLFSSNQTQSFPALVCL